MDVERNIDKCSTERYIMAYDSIEFPAASDKVSLLAFCLECIANE